MLPVSRKEFFDNFFLKVFLEQDRILEEFAVDVFEGDVFFLLRFLLINELRLFGFGFIRYGGDNSVVVIAFLLSLVLIF
jgi:hypothetical protein